MKKLRIFSYFYLLFIFLLLTGWTDAQIPETDFYSETDWHPIFKKFEKIETKHFVFYASKGEGVDTESQEKFYEYLANLFRIEPKEKIIYIKCRDNKHLVKIVGVENADENTGGIALCQRTEEWNRIFIIITISDWESHELVHIFHALIGGVSLPFFKEGLAVAHQINLRFYNHSDSLISSLLNSNSLRCHWLQNEIIESGEYISIGEILAPEDFESLRMQKSEMGNYCKIDIAYIEAGCFVRYLIDHCGFEKFFRFLKLSDVLDPESEEIKSEIEEKFLEVYSISIQGMEIQWLNFLKEKY